MSRFAILLVCICSLALADAPSKPTTTSEPKSGAAKSAIRKSEKAIRDAEDACARAKTAANEQLVKELIEAKKTAMSAQNLDEAVAIETVIKEARAGLPSGSGGAAFNPDGTYLTAQSKGKSAKVTFTGGKIKHHLSGEVAPYERQGNLIRVRWQSGFVTQYVFSGTTFKTETWPADKKPGVDEPETRGVGIRLDEQ